MTLILSLLLLICPSLNAQYSTQSVVPYNYSDFKTITTEHFNVHYPAYSSESFFMAQNMEEIAKKLSGYMEEAFTLLTNDLNSKPYLRVQVVIVDNTDSHNGFATPVPQNTIYVYAIPPLAHSSIGEYDNWLRDTAIHELTHIVNLSTTRGYSKVLRALFGTVVSINGMSPLNLIEAYTVYEETNLTKKGRGRSTYLHTMLRTAQKEGTLNSDGIYRLSKAPYIIDEWPLGNRPYLDGYLLMEHVSKKYGDDIPGKISKHNAGVIPYYPSYSFEQYTGKDIPELWDEMLSEKNTEYGRWNEQIENTPVTKIEDVINDGFSNRIVSLSPSGKKLAFHKTSSDKKEKIVIYDLDRDTVIKELSADGTSSIKWVNEDTIIYNRFHDEVDRSYYWLYSYSLSKNSSKRIKDSQRTLYAHPINTKDHCVVKALTGQMQIKISDKVVYTSPLFARLSFPVCVKINGKLAVYFVEKLPNEDEAIIRLFEGGTKETIYSSKGSIKDLKIKNGHIYFIDDPDGVFNIYMSDINGKNIIKRTNFISGAFDLDVNSNDIYVSYYTTDGFKIGRIDKSEQHKQGPVKSSYIKELPIRDLPEIKMEEGETSSYSPWKTLVPKFWVPAFAFVDGGFVAGGMTYGADSLFDHQYFLSGAYDSRTKSPYLSAAYINQSFYPTYSIYATTENMWVDDNAIIEDFTSGAGVSIPLDTSWSIGTGITYHYRTMDYEQKRIKRYGVYGLIGYGDTSTTWSAISDPESGLSGFLKYSIFPKAMDSTYSEYQIDSNLRFYIKLGSSHHVIAVNNDLSYSYGDPYMFFIAGGEFSSLIFGTKRYLMRGYPVSYFASRWMFVNNIEYRFPIVTINGGHNLFPIFFTKIHGALVSDNGFMGRDFKRNFHSGGIELRASGYILYHLPVTLRMGLYKGTDYKKGRFFIGVSSVF